MKPMSSKEIIGLIVKDIAYDEGGIDRTSLQWHIRMGSHDPKKIKLHARKCCEMTVDKYRLLVSRQQINKQLNYYLPF